MSKTSRTSRILTGEDVLSIPEGGILDVAPGTRLTDIAREWVDKRRIRIVETAPDADRPDPARLAIGSDHGGLELKQSLRSYLEETMTTFIDYGTHSKESVDYPDIAVAVAQAVVLGHARMGIVIDGAGIGSAIAANKIPGIRAGACYDRAGAANAREHNDINVMTLGASMMPPERLRDVVQTFLSATHSEPRHRLRVAKIIEIENKHYRPV